MKNWKLLLAALPLAILAACGGGDDLDDRLDVADPAVRLVNADSTATSNLSLYRDTTGLAEESNLAYTAAGNYIDVSGGDAVYTIRNADGSTRAQTSLNPERGNKYTFVALPGTNTTDSFIVYTDPYDKPLASDSTKVRVLHAVPGAPAIDVYLNQVGTDINTVNPNPGLTNIAYKTVGPQSGSESADIAGSTYTLSVTQAGTKTVLFQGNITFGNNQDILIYALPNTTGIRVFYKVNDGPAAGEVPPLAP